MFPGIRWHLGGKGSTQEPVQEQNAYHIMTWDQALAFRLHLASSQPYVMLLSIIHIKLGVGFTFLFPTQYFLNRSRTPITLWYERLSALQSPWCVIMPIHSNNSNQVQGQVEWLFLCSDKTKAWCTTTKVNKIMKNIHKGCLWKLWCDYLH